MEDEITYESKKISPSEMKKFRIYLASEAKKETEAKVFTNRYSGENISLRYLLDVYEAGSENKVPRQWLNLYNQMKRQDTEEYRMYLALHEKYKTPDPPLIEQESESKNVPKKRSRKIKKDGNVFKFQ